MMTRPRFYACIFLLALMPSVLSARAINSFNNTLYHNGRWLPTKIMLNKGVWGGLEFYFSRNALAHGKMDLSCWHGYQEVIYKKSIDPREIDLDFELSSGSYLVFEFNKDARQYSGVRLSLNKQFRNIYFISSDEGEFKFLKGLNVPPIRQNTRNRLRVIFDRDAVSFYLNGQFLGQDKVAPLSQQHFGFRGGFNKTLIDDVEIHDRNTGGTIKESFDNNDLYVLFGTLIVIALLNIFSGEFLYRRFNNTCKRPLFVLIMGNLVLSISIIIWLLFDRFYVSDRYYPVMKTPIVVARAHQYWSKVSGRYILGQIKKKYTNEKTKNKIRIIFIGSSQTWGSGARNENEGMVNRIEAELNITAPHKKRVECINAAISGYQAKDLFSIYVKKLIVLKPQMVVINLSSNDNDPVQFSNALKHFVELNRSKHIKTLFVMEANSTEYRQDMALHQIMRQVGRKKRVPVLDLNSYLALNYDKGFLWWDYVHLTSFGQRLAADFLSDWIAQDLN